MKQGSKKHSGPLAQFNQISSVESKKQNVSNPSLHMYET